MRLTIVVNGHEMERDFEPSTPARHVAARMLHETANVTPIAHEWELRDKEGFLFGPNEALVSRRVTDGSVLYLNAMAGVGG